jgi:hypothetical protein
MTHEPDSATREDLLLRVRRGELTPDEAEAQAGEHGLDPLATMPADHEHDPRDKSRWSLAMALAWIVWRDFGEVRAWDNDYRARCSRWSRHGIIDVRPGEREYDPSCDETYARYGHDLTLGLGAVTAVHFEQVGHASLAALSRAVMTPEQAKKGLWAALSDEKLAGEAVRASGGAYIEIPAIEWQGLEVREDVYAHDVLTLRYQPFARADDMGRATLKAALWPEGAHSGAAYFDLVLKRDDLLQLWPPLGPAMVRAVTTARAETDCYSWLAEEMRKSPNRRPKRRDFFLNEAQAKWPNLGEAAFLRAWGKAISETGADAWKAAGRPRKNSEAEISEPK